MISILIAFHAARQTGHQGSLQSTPTLSPNESVLLKISGGFFPTQ